jgi:hypothetical protein
MSAEKVSSAAAGLPYRFIVTHEKPGDLRHRVLELQNLRLR